MPRTRQPRAAAPPLTTAQALGSLVKSARDIMRKDKGLSGDLDRLPMLTWIMFLKFLDDMERIGEAEATMKGDRFRPAVEPPYRWRDWAARRASPATSCSSSSTRTRPSAPTARAGRVCSPIYAGSPAPTATTAAT
jgi:hypothetical protein